jgi:16S rRNA (uracil1498-N3)-methyltransferase
VTSFGCHQRSPQVCHRFDGLRKWVEKFLQEALLQADARWRDARLRLADEAGQWAIVGGPRVAPSHERTDVRPRFVVGDVCAGAQAGQDLSLPEGAARHVQVLRLQPGDKVWLLDGAGAGWLAVVSEMGRKSVQVTLVGPLARSASDVELPVRVTLAVGVPANDRMDALVEKATELGAWQVQPLLCERSVWRADGPRAEKKSAHWQGVAQAACEQSGRMVMPQVPAAMSLHAWLGARSVQPADAWFVLDPRAAQAWGEVLQRQLAGAPLASGGERAPHWVFVSGPEGGLSEGEVAACVQAGATAVRLGPRILRADTAPLAVRAALSSALER